MADATQSRMAYVASRPTAFAAMSKVQPTGNLGVPSIWNDKNDPFYQFAFADPSYKSQALQNLYRSLSNTASVAPGYKNNLDYLKDLLVKSGLSKNELTMSTALDKVVSASIASNTSPFAFLRDYSSTVSGAGKQIAQPDTTTQYTKQIQTALQFKDLGDARQYYSDSYFAAWGKYPSADLDKKFQDAWNTQVKEQDQPATTKTSVEKAPIYDKKSKPIIDPVTKQQKVDKFGNKVYSSIAKDKNGVYRYTDVITGTTTSQGQGFTQEEQNQFLADFLVANNPNTKWNVDDLGGAAKSVYDQIVAFSKANYSKVPDLASIAPIITKILGTPDAKVTTEYFTQYQSTIRKQTAAKYMSIADYINAGEDADKYVKPILETLSSALEKNFTIDDPFALSVFNFKDDKGVYRMPNALELNQMIMNHPDYGKTARAVNEAVDLTQNLRSKLGRG